MSKKGVYIVGTVKYELGDWQKLEVERFDKLRDDASIWPIIGYWPGSVDNQWKNSNNDIILLVEERRQFQKPER